MQAMAARVKAGTDKLEMLCLNGIPITLGIPLKELAMGNHAGIKLPDDTIERLAALSQRTGKDLTDYVVQAVEHLLEDMEDLRLAEEAMQRVRSGESEVITGEEFWRGLVD
jgi:RHH-type rel operon transcriptional repressor/antitoxin RelB